MLERWSPDSSSADGLWERRWGKCSNNAHKSNCWAPTKFGQILTNLGKVAPEFRGFCPMSEETGRPAFKVEGSKRASQDQSSSERPKTDDDRCACADQVRFAAMPCPAIRGGRGSSLHFRQNWPYLAAGAQQLLQNSSLRIFGHFPQLLHNRPSAEEVSGEHFSNICSRRVERGAVAFCFAFLKSSRSCELVCSPAAQA